ncbi:MAG: hypothetical protein IJ640_07180 [Prevotella sp.]|nr:hypothetical protein [Prevotella sp.]
MERSIYISVHEAARAVCSKDALEGLAFAVMIKMAFVSSRVNNPTNRNLMRIFRMGSVKTARVLKSALDNGYVRRDGKSIVACPIKSDGDFVCRFSFDVPSNGECPKRIKAVISGIRAAIVLNHVKKQGECGNTFNALTTGKDEDGNYIPYSRLKSICRRKQRMSLTHSFHAGLSNGRIMQLTNTKRYTERKLLCAMLGTGVINRRECIEETGIDPANFCRQASEYMREIGFGGYFFRRGGRILCQRTNIYGYCCDLISMYRQHVTKNAH